KNIALYCLLEPLFGFFPQPKQLFRVQTPHIPILVPYLQSTLTMGCCNVEMSSCLRIQKGNLINVNSTAHQKLIRNTI
ncbi:MAG: hypothetical protein ACQR30_03370, partial [Arachidicoccus sp.]